MKKKPEATLDQLVPPKKGSKSIYPSVCGVAVVVVAYLPFTDVDGNQALENVIL